MATWNAAYESNPSNLGAASAGYVSIRDPKTEVRIRMQNEHDTSTRASSGADGSRIKDWVHIQGAARTYYTTATPTSRPDGSTALSSNDDGRLLVHGDVLKVYSDGAFCNVPPIDSKQSKALKCVCKSIGALTLPNDIHYPASEYFRLSGKMSPDGGTVKVISFPEIPSDASIVRIGWSIVDDTENHKYNYPFLLSSGENEGGATKFCWAYTYLSNSKYFFSGKANISSAMRAGKTWSNTSINRGYVTVWYYE